MAKTISTHNGSSANREHNIRNPRATDKQEHIDKSLKGNNEILHDEKPREAYQRIFGEALAKYNARQTREDRKIGSYFSHIEKDAKKHPVYEMIVQIGDRNDTGIDAPEERACLKEFYEGWAERNPHLECIGAYIHADETDGTVHMHIDYVPVATGYKKGMEVQNGLVKALEQQGFTKEGKLTAQIQWEKRENTVLEAICERHGIEIVHPEGEKRKHLDTDIYKAQEQLKELQEDIIIAETVMENNQEMAEIYKQDADDAFLKLSEASESLETVLSEVLSLKEQKTALEGKIGQAEGILSKSVGNLKKLKADIENSLEQKAEIERELPVLKEQISEAKSELALVQRAVKEEMDKGARHFGSMDAFMTRIRGMKENDQKDARREKLADFADYLIKTFPTVKDLWEKFRTPEKKRSILSNDEKEQK